MAAILSRALLLRIPLAVFALCVAAFAPVSSWHHVLFAHESHEHRADFEHDEVHLTAVDDEHEHAEHFCHSCAQIGAATMLSFEHGTQTPEISSTWAHAQLCDAVCLPAEISIRNKSPPLNQALCA